MYQIKGNKLIVHDTWQMTIPEECHVNCVSQGATNQIRIIVGGYDLIDLYIADKKENQYLVLNSGIEILAKLYDEYRLVLASQYRDDSLRVMQATGYRLENHSFLSTITIDTTSKEHYIMVVWLPELEEEEHKKFLDLLNGNGCSEGSHPCNYGWIQAWRFVQQIAFSISPVGEKEAPEDTFRINGKDHPLTSQSEIIRGLTIKMPECLDQLQLDENTWRYLYNPNKLTKRQLRENLDRIKLRFQVLLVSIDEAEYKQSLPQCNNDNYLDAVVERVLLGMNAAAAFGSIQAKQLLCSRYKYLFLNAPDSDGTMEAAILVSQQQGYFALISIRGLDSNICSPHELARSAWNVFDSIDLSDDELRLPMISASDFQIEHLNALTSKTERKGDAISNGAPRHTGVDFEPKSIRELLENDGLNDNIIYWQIRKFLKEDSYTLDDSARKMAEIFHVPDDEFDSSSDTEAFIHAGIISHAYKFSALRSLAWTTAEFARQYKRDLDSFSFAELEQIGEHIEKREWRCYSLMSHFPGLCDQCDYHVFYLPDVLLLHTKNMNLFDATLSFDTQWGKGSLEALRHDLAALKPVMDTICKGLGRNPQGPLAAALEAWCALCVAAKEPFLSEDGKPSYHLDMPGIQRPYGEFDADEEGEWDTLNWEIEADTNPDDADTSDDEDDKSDDEEGIDRLTQALHEQLIEVGFLTE